MSTSAIGDGISAGRGFGYTQRTAFGSGTEQTNPLPPDNIKAVRGVLVALGCVIPFWTAIAFLIW